VSWPAGFASVEALEAWLELPFEERFPERAAIKAAPFPYFEIEADEEGRPLRLLARDDSLDAAKDAFKALYPGWHLWPGMWSDRGPWLWCSDGRNGLYQAEPRPGPMLSRKAWIKLANARAVEVRLGCDADGRITEARPGGARARGGVSSRHPDAERAFGQLGTNCSNVAEQRRQAENDDRPNISVNLTASTD